MFEAPWALSVMPRNLCAMFHLRCSSCMFVALVWVVLFCFYPDCSFADSINGFLDFNYSNFSSKTTDASGRVTTTESNNFIQRYNLLINKSIYPKLNLDAGGLFEENLSYVKSGGMDTKTTNSSFRPFLSLSLTDPIYSAGAGYYLREQRLSSSNSSTVTMVNEEYNGIFGWRPVGFPTLEMRVSRTNTFDRERSILDITKDFFSLRSQYAYKGFDLRYYGTYTQNNDKLHYLETQDTLHNFRGAYSGSFFNGRGVLGANYVRTHEQLNAFSTSSGGGTFSTQIFPFAGFSALNDTPTVGTLDPNPALIDANLIASSSINIGVPPLGGDLRARNIGLDLLNVTEVNNLLVWVDRELPANISSSFSWDIYTSSNNLNWTFYRTVFPAPFGPFQNRFEIDFPNVKTRYIKVVVRPLSGAVAGASAFPDIFISEIQAFLKQPVGGGSRELTQTIDTQTANTDFKFRILSNPFLYYEFTYYFTKVDPSGLQTWFLSNGMSVNHRFSESLTGTARVAREDGTERNLSMNANVYTASILATPLKTLRNSLIFSGRDAEVGGKQRNTNSLFLNNTAQLYKGLDVSLNGGISSLMEVTGEKQKTAILNAAANIVPHRTMTLTLSLFDTRTDRSGPGVEDSTSITRRGDITLAFNPLRTLYLLASISRVDQTGQGTLTFQNYGLNWSPFPDGALQFRFSYNENLRPEDNFKQRIVTPGIRYNISQQSYLDFSYQYIKTDSPSEKIETKIFNALLKLVL